MADATRESPGIGRAGGPGDFGLGGGWPDDHHKEFLFPIEIQGFHSGFHSSQQGMKAIAAIAPKEVTIRRWCSPWAAPAEVEVLATGVGPG